MVVIGQGHACRTDFLQRLACQFDKGAARFDRRAVFIGHAADSDHGAAVDLMFGNQFVGKSIFKGDQYVGISVLKGVGSSQGNDNAVDAISGGTITSRAVQSMIIDNLKFYLPYILKQQTAAQ